MTITEFLLARIAEDEAVARDVDDVAWAGLFDGTWGGVNDHGARHDPARVLAECEAKRRIIAGCVDAIGEELTMPYGGASGLGQHTVAHLAVVYADHPDYRDEWRP